MDDELKQFLHKANTNGYGSANVSRQNLPSGEHIITFAEGDFEFRDVYYGGEPYAGLAHFDAEETISRNGKVVYTARFLSGLVDVKRKED